MPEYRSREKVGDWGHTKVERKKWSLESEIARGHKIKREKNPEKKGTRRRCTSLLRANDVFATMWRASTLKKRLPIRNRFKKLTINSYTQAYRSIASENRGEYSDKQKRNTVISSSIKQVLGYPILNVLSQFLLQCSRLTKCTIFGTMTWILYYPKIYFRNWLITWIIEIIYTGYELNHVFLFFQMYIFYLLPFNTSWVIQF